MKASKEFRLFVFLFCGAVLIFFCACILLINWQLPALPNEIAQQWALKANIGQAFGVLSAGFAALAFSAALLTIRLQQKQLDLQRDEVEKSHDQLRRTAEAQERSVNALQRQAELLATSARLRGLAALLETNLKIKEVQLAEHTQSVASGRLHLNFENVAELYDELAEELNKLSGKTVSNSESSSPPHP